MIEVLFSSLTVWHWLVLGLVLFGIEVLIGTYDLLWIASAALLTALYAALPLPGGWQVEVIVFAVAALVLVLVGRTLFKGLRLKENTTHPTLNQRGAGMVGQTGITVSTFVAGQGRVRIGDSEWSASSANGADLKKGVTVSVSAADGTRLTVVEL